MKDGGQSDTLIPGNRRENLENVVVLGKIPLKSDISIDSKKKLVEILKELYIISETFTGKVFINFGQGGITEIERIEKIR